MCSREYFYQIRQGLYKLLTENISDLGDMEEDFDDATTTAFMKAILYRKVVEMTFYDIFTYVSNGEDVQKTFLTTCANLNIFDQFKDCMKALIKLDINVKKLL